MGGGKRPMGHHDHSGGTSHPPLPPSPPVDGDSHCTVPLWEREFCTQALNMTWESLCEIKCGTAVFQKIMDWDDSGAFVYLKAAKERFRAKYFGIPSEHPLPDPDMYTDKVDKYCKVDPELAADLDNIRLQLGMDNDSATATGLGGLANVRVPFGFNDYSAAAIGLGGPANLIPAGWGEPANLEPTGWGEPGNVAPMGQGEVANPTPEVATGGQANPTPETAWAGQAHLLPVRVGPGQARLLPPVRIWVSQYSSNLGNSNFRSGGTGTGPSNNRHQQEDLGHWSFGSGMRRDNGGGGGGSGSGGQRNQGEGQRQQRSGGRQQQGQRGKKKMVWRPMQRK